MIEYVPSNKCRVDLMIRKRKNLFNLKYMYIFLAFLSLSIYKRTWKNKTEFLRNFKLRLRFSRSYYPISQKCFQVF